MIRKSILKSQSPVSSSELSTQLNTISTKLLTYDTTANLSITNLSANKLHHLSTANPKAKTDTTKLEIIDSSLSTNLHIGYTQNLNSQHYLSLLVTPEDATSNNLEFSQKQSLTSNILPITISHNKFLAAIFPFELKETMTILLFSGATLDTKLITTIYTNVKVDGHAIKLILDSRSAGSRRVDHVASAHIITTDGTTKIPIGEIDDFLFEVNGIIISIKVLVMEATQY
ncbi:hypothetical protein G9A89_017794 [Geosiphon pyriformis]|nr:hypothetical protein G9A89_017794 [Geosiphon pyriformis]